MKNFNHNWLIKALHLSSEPQKTETPFNGKPDLKKIWFNTSLLKRNKQKVIVSTDVYEVSHLALNNTCSPSEKNPLRFVQRYTMNFSDQHAFYTRRMTEPFNSIYEIEWQQNQWLQLDKETCKYIERLRRLGFSKIYIRQDKNLKAHMAYENRKEMDILLEISLKCDQKPQNIRRPIGCQLPSSFPLRRTKWWCTSYKTGIANLPYWVDKSLCHDSINIHLFDTSTLSYYPSLEYTPSLENNHSQNIPLHYTEPFSLS